MSVFSTPRAKIRNNRTKEKVTHVNLKMVQNEVKKKKFPQPTYGIVHLYHKELKRNTRKISVEPGGHADMKQKMD